jgi:serine/threonine protein kinase
MSAKDFKFLGSLGQGAFGDVILVEQIKTKKRFAMKIIIKQFLKKVLLFNCLLT